MPRPMEAEAGEVWRIHRVRFERGSCRSWPPLAQGVGRVESQALLLPRPAGSLLFSKRNQKKVIKWRREAVNLLPRLQLGQHQRYQIQGFLLRFT